MELQDYQVWLILGAFLAIIELLLTSFFVLWFSVAAFIIGIVTYFIDVSLFSEMSVWLIISLLNMTLWFKWFEPKYLKKAINKEDFIGEVGVISQSNERNKKEGVIKFSAPIGGSDLWNVVSDNDFDVGDRMIVSEFNKEILKVYIKEVLC